VVAKGAPAAGPEVFRGSWRAWVLGVLLFGLSGFMGVVGWSNHRNEPGSAAGIAVVALSMAYFGLVTALVRWRIDERALERVTPFTKRARVPWRDITAIIAQENGSLLIRGTSGDTLLLPRLARHRDLWRLVLERAPRAALGDGTRRFLSQGADVGAETTSVPVHAPEENGTGAPDRARRWRENPFFVLALSPECSQVEVERAGQKLLAMLAIGSRPAATFETPFGAQPRTEEGVRAAMAELRDPERRLAHEIWARAGLEGAEAARAATPGEALLPWDGAMAAIGVRAK
jgi:hypothetical protein